MPSTRGEYTNTSRHGSGAGRPGTFAQSSLKASASAAAAEKALRARGFVTRHDADQIEARTPTAIPITAEAIWDWEKAGTEEVLPFDFWPDGWEIEE
jgi:hypothetical protein